MTHPVRAGHPVVLEFVAGDAPLDASQASEATTTSRSGQIPLLSRPPGHTTSRRSNARSCRGARVRVIVP
jgi:hypothetical protein